MSFDEIFDLTTTVGVRIPISLYNSSSIETFKPHNPRLTQPTNIQQSIL